MISQEDPSTVLEQFIHDVANLPAEIQHLMEEMDVKEREIQTLRAQINKRDSSLQKFVKLNGSMVLNPNEEAYNRFINQAYAKAQTLQEEKIALSSKSAALLDRQIKRFDLKLRGLENDGQIPPDPQLPSLLRDSPGNLVPPASATGTGANTPLQPFSSNAGASAPNIANAAIARMQLNASGSFNGTLPGAPAAGSPMSMLNPNAANRGSAQPAEKKRRIGAPTHVPMPASNVRAGSMDRSTPKAGTPGSRAGSAQPTRPVNKKTSISSSTARKVPPHTQALKKSVTMKSIGGQKKSRRSTAASTPTEAEDEEDDDDEEEEEEGGEEESDDTKYCVCQSVSYGDMVACDNANCPYQWFHWGCIGMTKEPLGDWLCDHCRKLPTNQIVKQKHDEQDVA